MHAFCSPQPRLHICSDLLIALIIVTQAVLTEVFVDGLIGQSLQPVGLKHPSVMTRWRPVGDGEQYSLQRPVMRGQMR